MNRVLSNEPVPFVSELLPVARRPVLFLRSNLRPATPSRKIVVELDYVWERVLAIELEEALQVPWSGTKGLDLFRKRG